VPGIYQVRLTIDGKTQNQSLTVIMDPRSPATPEVLAQQLHLGQQIFAETIEAHRALAEIASVQKQLADIQQKLEQNKSGARSTTLKAALAEAQSGIARILTNKEQATENSGLKDAYTAVASALRVVESGDRAVPSQAIALYKESGPQVKARIAEWMRFKQTRLAQLNQQLREADFSPVAISEIEQEVEFLISR
jgi:predicted RND superfamily exporter protein